MPRTEIMINSSGVWQFEGYGIVPNGTSGVICTKTNLGPYLPSVIAIDCKSACDLALLMGLASSSLQLNYHWWFRLNVIHDADASKVTVYIDGVQVIEAPGRGGKSHYFKCGVHSQPDASYYMESRWKGIKVRKKMQFNSFMIYIFGLRFKRGMLMSVFSLWNES
ncbi:unnamed protein product [Coffea canephora]|uniref:Alginate lyase 2 domain-containing protein n=1 Tax=Coffea canephora TaxID=49390 RepID=A0A068V3U3_COFCA|nr:unnamed protein product [Coffea canephora]